MTKNGARLLDEQNLKTIIKLGLECTRQNKMILKQHAIINQLNCCIKHLAKEKGDQKKTGKTNKTKSTHYSYMVYKHKVPSYFLVKALSTFTSNDTNLVAIHSERKESIQ